jgi:outer membrane protein assembly factor BamB
MRHPLFAILIPIGLIIIGIVSLYIWLRPEEINLAERLPIAENAQQTSSDEAGGKLQGELIHLGGKPSDLHGVWPRFRGADFDAINKENVSLARNWPPDGPKVLWSIDVGEGYAGPAVLNGCVYILDYDQKKQADAIRCLSLADGQEIWRYSYPVKIKRNHGMSRTVPAVTDKFIVTFGPKCHVTCLDSVTGQFHWMLDLVKDFNAKEPPWYAGQCPLIDNDKAIIAIGGKQLMIAVDCQTGKIVWQSPNSNHWVMTHSSIMPIEFAGKRMYVYCASGGVVGISAEDGSILWQSEEWKIRVANVPSPVIVGDGLIFLCGDYNAGSMILKLAQKDNKIIAEPALRLGPEIFGSPQHTPIFYKGHIYGVNAKNELACLDLNGKVLWTSTSAHKFGRGPYIIADDLIYVMNDDGELTMAEATPIGYKPLAEARVLNGPDSWGPMAIVQGRLILRDLNRMICLKITAN